MLCVKKLACNIADKDQDTPSVSMELQLSRVESKDGPISSSTLSSVDRETDGIVE